MAKVKLKALVKDINTVPEAYRDMYDQDGDVWVLDTEDKDYKAKIAEFRDNNRALMRTQEELRSQADKYKDIDPTKYAEAMEAMKHLDALEDAQLIKQGKFEEIVSKRTKLMGAEYENQLKAQKTAREQAEARAAQYQGKLGEVLIDAEIHKAVTNVAQPRRGAMGDILNRAKSAWGCDENGNLKARGEGLFNEKGEPMTMDDYARRLVTEAPHLFESGGGGGSQGGRQGNGQRQGPKTISRDPVSVGRNLEDVASGRVEVEGYSSEE